MRIRGGSHVDFWPRSFFCFLVVVESVCVWLVRRFFARRLFARRFFCSPFFATLPSEKMGARERDMWESLISHFFPHRPMAEEWGALQARDPAVGPAPFARPAPLPISDVGWVPALGPENPCNPAPSGSRADDRRGPRNPLWHYRG